MVTVALLVRLEAKRGKEAEVEQFLKSGLALVEGEPATTAWFAIRLGPFTFGIFDAFPNEAGRDAHLTGKVAAALMEKAGDLFVQPPVIEKVDVLAAKLPQKDASKQVEQERPVRTDSPTQTSAWVNRRSAKRSTSRSTYAPNAAASASRVLARENGQGHR